jgi:hypothetical protein
VELDLQFPRETFQGAESSESSSFDVWENCDILAPAQKLEALSGECSGFELFLIGRARRTRRYKIGRCAGRGRFRVESAGGPLMGLMVIRLTPVPQPDFKLLK